MSVVSPTVRLGARLAWGTPGQRGRSLLVVVAAAVGSVVLLAVLAVASAEQSRGSTTFSDTDLSRLTLAVVLAVALPVVVLAATVGRLSASLRDRRLANLRLLGLTPTQTRLVAATEAGVGAGLGAVAGAVLFALVRPALAGLDPLEHDWSSGVLAPGLVGWGLAVAGVPLVTVLVAALPHRYDARSTLDRARRRDARRPSPLRLLPLAAGLVLCSVGWRANDDRVISGSDVAVIFGGIALVGLGVVLVVPVFVRLLADLLLAASRRPAGLVAARRLQAQPASVTRVVSGLMIGLFLVIGARCVVVAFEETPQYQNAAYLAEVQQRVELQVTPRRAGALAPRLAAADGVDGVLSMPALVGTQGERLRPRWMGEVQAVVATCADLRTLVPDLADCTEGQVLSLGHGEDSWLASSRRPLTLTSGNRDGEGPTLTLPAPTRSLDVGPLQANLLVPPDTAGIGALVEDTRSTLLVVHGPPGRDLAQTLPAGGFSMWDVAYYDFVAGLRTIVWTLASVVLGVGLLTFAIAAIDRVLTRRRELTSLRVLGTPPSTVRRTQWLEAVLPTSLGSLLAIAAGFLAGATYLRIDGSTSRSFPWSSALTLAAVSLVASVVIAGLTVLASNTRLSPDHLRTE